METYKGYVIEIQKRDGTWWAFVSDVSMNHRETFSGDSEEEVRTRAEEYIDWQDEP
jgi:predicted RNase H-like HicB family nuclease